MLLCGRLGAAIEAHGLTHGEHLVRRLTRGRRRLDRVESVRVRRHLSLEQRDPLRPRRLADEPVRRSAALALVHRGGALEVRQREVALAVAAVVRPQKREQGGVLRDRHKLPVALRPTRGREIEAEDTDLGDKRICHDYLLIR
jgi:hypothetical protein